MQLGMNESRPDAVDSDILFRDFLRQTNLEMLGETRFPAVRDQLYVGGAWVTP